MGDDAKSVLTTEGWRVGIGYPNTVSLSLRIRVVLCHLILASHNPVSPVNWCPGTEISLTSSSLYQERDSAVRTNQYSLEPPFMMLMLMVSQPFLITCKVRGRCGRQRREVGREGYQADGGKHLYQSGLCTGDIRVPLGVA